MGEPPAGGGGGTKGDSAGTDYDYLIKFLALGKQVISV